MPSFITRVELQSATKKDYQILQEEMKKASFRDAKKINLRKQLPASPSIEFNRNGNSLLEVTDAAVKAVRKTGRNYSFTVIKERKLSTH